MMKECAPDSGSRGPGKFVVHADIFLLQKFKFTEAVSYRDRTEIGHTLKLLAIQSTVWHVSLYVTLSGWL